MIPTPTHLIALGVLAISGCSAVFGLDHPVQGTADGAPGDTGSRNPVCVGQANFIVCIPADVPSELTFSQDTTIQTDQPCTFVDTMHPTWCIYAARNVSVLARVRATGASPFAIVATENLTIGTTGSIDVASHLATTAGTGVGAGGGNDPRCGMAGIGEASVNGGAGGAGGTFGTAGGHGGTGNGAGTGGGAPAVVDVQETGSRLRGGCAGAYGGNGSSTGEPPGAGGGSIYIAAGGALDIAGTVNASGAGGGRGNASKGGGSGGGSGGMIAVWATTLTFTGQLFANGGGGGGGADNGAQGNPGGDSTAFNAPGHGGFGGGTSSCGGGPGCGGDGAAIRSGGGDGIDDTTGAGGGGGGGGLGMIRVVSGQSLTGSLSPPTI